MEHSDLVDPLSGYSPFSSFRPNLIPNNFASLLSHLKNMALKNPDSLVSQAKAIKEGSMELLENDQAKVSAFEGKTEAPVAVNGKSHQETRPAPGREKNHRERRPGLGLRQAKFTLKPTPSQAVEIQEPTIDIDKLSDPVEFFAAFERMETAKKELRRLRGEPLAEVDLNNVTLSPRAVRPSQWRKSVTYKPHPYPSSGVPNNDDALVLSQEANNHSIMSPTREAAIAESNAVKSPPKVRGSDVKTSRSSKVSELDELLSYDYKGLDEDGIQKLLQDKLNLKFVDIGEPSLPDMPPVRQREYSSVTQPLPNIKDSISHINDSSKTASSNLLNFSSHFRKVSDNQASPSLSKSPLAAISTLNKHISRLTPLKDPFLPIDVNLSSDKISHAVAQIGKRNDSQELSRNPVNEKEATDAPTSPSLAGKSKTADIESVDQLDGVGHSDQLVTSKTSHEFGRSPSRTEDAVITSEKLPLVTAKDTVLGDDSEEQMNEFRQNDQVDSRDNLFEIRSPEDNEDNLAAFGEASLDCASKAVDASSVPIEIDDQTAAAQEPVVDEVFSEGFAVEKALVNRGDTEMDEPLNTSGLLTEKLNKKTLRSSKSGGKEIEELTAPSQDNMTVNKGRKGKAKSNAATSKEPQNKKRKAEGARASPRKVDEKLRRLSLYDAGTKWEAGVRRSTRIRMRPLEFWRGERFLYGRVHESTVSVIGVKYASPPAKSAEGPVVKVKSFVSDKYKNLVDLASSY